MRRQITEGEKIFAKSLPDKELLPKINKEFLKPNDTKMNNPTEKWAKGLNRHLTEEDQRSHVST